MAKTLQHDTKYKAKNGDRVKITGSYPSADGDIFTDTRGGRYLSDGTYLVDADASLIIPHK